MARVLDTGIKIKNAAGDNYEIEIAEYTYTVPQGTLIALVNGEVDMLQLALGNIALRLALAGVDPTDEKAVSSEIEKVSFKLFR